MGFDSFSLSDVVILETDLDIARSGLSCFSRSPNADCDLRRCRQPTNDCHTQNYVAESARSKRRTLRSKSMKIKMICCAILACAAVLIPTSAKAQTESDKKFLAMAAQSDQNEIKLSELAEEKASNPDVKAFAEKMVTEHRQMTESMKPFANSWGLTPPDGPDADHQKELDKLNGLSGADFDKEYISQMVTDHTKALSAFTSEAGSAKDMKFRAAVLQGKTMVAAHKNMAYDLKKKL